MLLGYQIAQEQQDYSRMQSAEQLLLTTYPQSQESLLLSQGKLTESEFSQLRQDYKQQLLRQPAEQVKAGAGQPKIKITRKKAPVTGATESKVLPATLTAQMQSQAKTVAVQHQVQQDESLYGIAERYSVTISDIISWNSLRDNQPIVKGQILWIGQQAHRQIEPQIEVPERYQIQDGDTLFRISMRYRVKLTSLLQWNNLTEQSPIRAGQFIYLKDPAQLRIMTTELTQPSSAVNTLSAGQLLRQAREQQNLTLAQVAQQLNLSRSLIDDLEQDQVDAKLSSTFVRGYLRSYAKLLKIPAQQVLDAYSSNSKGLHQVPSLTRSFSKRTAKEATENRFMWVTYFVIAVFVVLLVLGFWQSRFGGSGSGSALPMAQTDETMLASEEVKPVNAQPYQQTEQPEAQQNRIPVTQLDHSPTATDPQAQSTAPQTSLNADVPTVIQPQSQAVVTQPAATVPAGYDRENSATRGAATTPAVNTTCSE